MQNLLSINDSVCTIDGESFQKSGFGGFFLKLNQFD